MPRHAFLYNLLGSQGEEDARDNYYIALRQLKNTGSCYYDLYSTSFAKRPRMRRIQLGMAKARRFVSGMESMAV